LNLEVRTEIFNILNHANFKPRLDNGILFNPDGSPVGNIGFVDVYRFQGNPIRLETSEAGYADIPPIFFPDWGAQRSGNSTERVPAQKFRVPAAGFDPEPLH
jgi:hypothetical protein